MTTFLLVDIPLFREILLCSFRCEHCGESNNEVQFAGRLPDLGVEILFRCLQAEDLNREIVRSEYSTLYIEELDLELPSKKAEITNLEDLSAGQEQRKETQPEEHAKIALFLEKVKHYSEGKQFPLTVKVRDPSGNSNIKNPFAPRLDKQMEMSYFRRTLEELKKMGYSIENAEEELKNEQDRELEAVGNKYNFSEPFQEDKLMKHEPVSF
jgi:zinc finger protein